MSRIMAAAEQCRHVHLKFITFSTRQIEVHLAAQSQHPAAWLAPKNSR